MIAVDFSLALHNRTGKFFIGRDVIDLIGPSLSQVFYGRTKSATVPEGLRAKVIGRILDREIRARLAWPLFDAAVPKLRASAPTLHLDPMTVLVHQLQSRDVVLCHDVGPISNPDLFHPRTHALYQACYRAIAAARPRVAFMSEATKTAYEAYFGAAPEGSRVIYSNIRQDVTEPSDEAVAGVTRPFLLTVGNIGDRKNQARAIRAFAASGLAERGVSYVLCGGNEPGYEEARALVASTPGVLAPGYVTSGQLRWLYANATGFVLPSLLEGFGVPVAEAARAGVVPLVSRDSVLEEVGGPGVISVDPTDVGAIASGMIELVSMSDADRQARLARLAEDIKRFDKPKFDAAWRAMLFGPRP